jgi:hypothetical protein
MRDNHAGGEVDGAANKEDLALPDNAVGLEGSPDGALGPGDWRNVACGSMLFFVAVDHAVFPRPSRRLRAR